MRANGINHAMNDAKVELEYKLIDESNAQNQPTIPKSHTVINCPFDMLYIFFICP
jgi:hypothetical protein